MGAAATNVALLRWWAAAAVYASSVGRVDAISAHGRVPTTDIVPSEPGVAREALLELKAQRSLARRAAKPVRIFRGGEDQGPGEDIGAARPESHVSSRLKCGATEKVNSKSDKMERCPGVLAGEEPRGITTTPLFGWQPPSPEDQGCPYFAQDKLDDEFCTFRCVPAAQCSEINPKTPIADPKLGVCRSCIVDGCLECGHFKTDTCARCQSGYRLGDDGKCHNKYTWILQPIGWVVGVILLLVAVWLLDFFLRPAINKHGLDRGMKLRELQKLRMAPNAQGDRELWPITTNLMREQVAGPGMSLHFNFQAAIVVWAFFVAAVWACFALFVDPALWILGTRRFGTPRENCILVAWGYETQQRLMWTKVAFLWIVYIGSFIMSLAFSVIQLRKFQNVDYQHKTMKDYAAMMEGLPAMSGDNVEEELKEIIRNRTGQKVVGVSVGWDFAEHEEKVKKALDDDLKQAEDEEQAKKGEQPEVEDGEVIHTGLRRQFFRFERRLFGEEEAPYTSEAAEQQGSSLEETLRNMSTSPNAFVVFETQGGRDKAVEALRGGFEVRGRTGVTLQEITCEPDTVQWANFGHAGPMAKVIRLAIGFGVILGACLFWAVVFYSPYAWYVMNFNYENGRQPGFIVGFAFSMIVVIGNAIMYEVCAQISDKVGFRFKDDREACYMILYTIACLFNILLDFATTYKTAFYVMVGLGFRTYFGVPLDEVPTETEVFETYAMQRSLAENTYSYAFPSTYLIPFLIEPAVAIGLPLALGWAIVRSHPEVGAQGAEEWVASVPMEMGRYADILLNVILGILIFYFPGGYTAGLFFAMACSHAYIYLFDHWRVLRSIPSCVFASMDVDWWAQAMLAPCVGIMAACLVFKSNCEPGYHCVKGATLVFACTAGWVLHVAVHISLLRFVVPKFGLPEPKVDPEENKTFAELARGRPCSWFTANPVHCLRSKYIHKDSPPCNFFVLGKERFLKANRIIGCYYEEKDDSKLKGLGRGVGV